MYNRWTRSLCSRSPSPTPIAPMVVIEPSPATQCPVRPSSQPSMSQPPARCPVANAPIDHRNNMPVESQEPAPGQSSNLPTTRVISSIPRPPDSTYGHQTNSEFGPHVFLLLPNTYHQRKRTGNTPLPSSSIMRCSGRASTYQRGGLNLWFSFTTD